MEYTIIRSKRKTISIQIKDCKVIVRAPNRMPVKAIDDFVQQHASWVEKHLQQMKDSPLFSDEKLSEREIDELRQKAKEWIPRRVAYYATMIGVSYNQITIRMQKTLWGSCSSKGNLNFNCLLMLAPPEVIDSVVVHELCHRKEMNHSDRFYKEVLQVYPDYHKWNTWLKKNGKAILHRVP